jgi:hypothetical protein
MALRKCLSNLLVPVQASKEMTKKALDVIDIFVWNVTESFLPLLYLEDEHSFNIVLSILIFVWNVTESFLPLLYLEDKHSFNIVLSILLLNDYVFIL